MGEEQPSVETVFAGAVDLATTAEREAYLERACGGDADLRRRVELLLGGHARAGDFLDAPAAATLNHPRESGAVGPGTTVGPYKLLEEIGEGGMGVVYMAEQVRSIRRRVALKVVKPGMDSRQVIARFEAERQALALMEHPNIARVHDAGTTEAGRPYFVMELVRGLPITEFCDRGNFTIPQRLELFVKVCQAVQHAHQKGIIHRDLKPSNVLITVVDGEPVPKVIDFGIAKATGVTLTDRTLFTGFHHLVGTPLYMSPEQADLTSSDVDTRSDIYSLGVLLYELLTGSTPFDPETLRKAAFDELRRIIREDEPPRPSTKLEKMGETLSTVSARRGSDPRRLDKMIRGELDWIAMKALEKDRRRRYATANDFAADVMRYLDDRPVEACPPTAWYRWRKSARRHRVGLTTTALVVLALMAGTVVSVLQAVRATRAERNERANMRAAEAQRSRAEERLAYAREAVDAMYTRVAEKWLAGQPALTRLQREFLERALAFYERFAAEAGDDPKARHEAVLAMVRVGRIRRALEENREAEVVLRRAIGLAVESQAAYPAHDALKAGLAVARFELARVLEKTGKKVEAEAEMRQALAGQRALRDKDPRDPEPRRELIKIEDTLGDILKDVAGRSDEALASYRAAVKEAAELVRDHPDDMDYRIDAARANTRLGGSLTGQTDEEKETCLRNALTDLDGPRRHDPRDAQVRELTGNAWSSLGLFYTQTKRYAEAEEATRKAIAEKEVLASEFPELPHHTHNLAVSYNTLSILLKEMGRASESEEATRKALDIEERLADSHPEVPDYRHAQARCANNLVNLHTQRGEFREGVRLLEKLVPQEKALAEAHPENTRYGGIYGLHVLRMCHMHLELGEHVAAAGYARMLAGIDLPGEVERRANYSENAGWILSCCALAAEEDTALSEPRRSQLGRAYLDEANALFVEAARRAAKKPLVFASLAQVYAAAGSKRLRDPVRALELARRATEGVPKSAFAWSVLGMAEYRNGHGEAALTAVDKSLEIAKGQDDGRAWLVKALVYAERGDGAEARRNFELADAERVKLVKRTGRGWDKISGGGAALLALHAEAAGRIGAMGKDR